MQFEQEGTLFYYIPPEWDTNLSNVIAFDLDWTLTYGEQHLFPRNPEDIHVLPRRKKKLKKLYGKGFKFVVFTNQSAKSVNEKLNRVARVTTFLSTIGIPMAAFIATGKDDYRKPEQGMWNKMSELLPDSNVLYYVGDALGRPQDFSDSDKVFAEKRGLDVYPPERFFKEKVPTFPSIGKELVIFVGAPGTGKTTFYARHLEPLFYNHVNQDQLKTAGKVKTATKYAMKEGIPICVDGTNSSMKKRQVFYDLAVENEYNVTVIYFTRDGYGWNKLREKPVPAVAYHIFYKHLVPPTKNNTPGRVIRI